MSYLYMEEGLSNTPLDETKLQQCNQVGNLTR